MSDTAVRPSGLPEVAYPPAVSLGAAWPWLLFGVALLALIYFVGMDEGALSVVPGTLAARVGPRRAPPPRLPLPLGRRRCSEIFSSAASSPGFCGGLVATGFARVVGEGAVDQAIAYEEAHAAPAAAEPAGGHSHADESPVVSRTMQKSFGLLTAGVVYGLAIGGLFAIAFTPIYGRVGRASPARTALWLAAGAFVVVSLVPFVKYPATPPAVGDPETIGTRTGAFVTMIAISILAAFAAVRLRALLAERWPGRFRDDRRRGRIPRRGRRRRPAAAVGARGAGVVPAGDAVPLPRGLHRHASRALDDARVSYSPGPRSAS